MHLPHQEFGPQIGIYNGKRINRGEIITIFFLFIALFVIPFLVGFYRAVYGYAHYGVVAGISWGLVWFIFSFSILILIAIYCIYRLNIARFSISLHKSGVYFHRLLGKSQFFQWNDISALYVNLKQVNSKYRALSINALIRTKENETLSLRESSIENLPELITQIKSAVYIHLNPVFRERFRAGEAISFGPIDIQRKYIKIKRLGIKPPSPIIPWMEVSLITVRSGYLLVKLNNNSLYRIRAAKIPNLEILLRLIEDKTRE